MTRRALVHVLALCLLLSALLPISVAGAESAPLPTSMAAVGDSITQAASSAGSLGADAPQNSWSTGTSTTVNSHYLRLLGAGADISGRNYNRSVSGAKVADLAGQMADAATLQPDYLTVLIGGNDLCTDTVAEMTSVADFHARFQSAMTTLNSRSPATNVYVVSIPNVYQLWELFKGNFWARFVWATADICQSLLANPTSTQTADVQRREAVRQRNIDFNAALADVCAKFDVCHFDGNAVFNTPFTTSDVSGDYFHPSVAGQAKLARVSWEAGFDWTTPPPPPPENQAPTADFTYSCGGLSCSFANASSDDAGVTSFSWSFGDTTGSTEPNPTHTYEAAGSYSVTLTVADAAGLTDSATQTVTVAAEPPPTATVSVASVDASSAVTGKNTWAATAVATLVASDGRPVDGATVTFTWSTGSNTCVTVGSTCSVTSENLNRRKVGSLTMTVTGVQYAGYTWDGIEVGDTATGP